MQQSGVGSSTSGETVEEGFMEELSFQEQDRPGQVKIGEEGNYEEPRTGLRCFRRKGGQWSGHSYTRLWTQAWVSLWGLDTRKVEGIPDSSFNSVKTKVPRP